MRSERTDGEQVEAIAAETCPRCSCAGGLHKFDCPNLVFDASPPLGLTTADIAGRAEWDRAQAIADRNFDLDETWLGLGALR